MICCICFKELEQNSNGSYKQCCKSLGYWSSLEPLPKDAWYSVRKQDNYTLYIDPDFNYKRKLYNL